MGPDAGNMMPVTWPSACGAHVPGVGTLVVQGVL